MKSCPSSNASSSAAADAWPVGSLRAEPGSADLAPLAARGSPSPYVRTVLSGRAPRATRQERGPLTLQEAAAQADALAQQGDEKGLATLRQQWGDELEHAARDRDYRVRAHAYRAIAQFRFRQKLELVRRGLQDESPAARGSALIALEGLSRDHPGDVNSMRAMLHELATNDPNMAVRRLAIVCLKNGSAQRETILILNGLADDDEQEQELRKTAKTVAAALTKKSRS
jgi:HEAT repeat protein